MEISRDRKFMSVGIIIFLLVILSNFLDGSRKAPPVAGKAAAQAPVAYLDAGTGCEYLLLPGARLTPRMEPGGRQRCHTPPPIGPAAGKTSLPDKAAPSKTSLPDKASPSGKTSLPDTVPPH